MITRTFVARASQASRSSSNPNRAYTAMKYIMKLTVKVLKAEYVVDLMNCLCYRNIPLRCVRIASKKFCAEVGIDNKFESITGSTMKYKLKDAQKCLSKVRREYSDAWKSYEPVLVELRVFYRFVLFWKEEKAFLRRTLNIKKKDKIDHLTRVYRNVRQNVDRPAVEVEQLRGIIIKNQEVPSDVETKPRLYGGRKLDTQEVDVLSLGPKFAVYGRVNKHTVQVEIEKAITKLQWDCIKIAKEKDKEEQEGELSINSDEDRRWPYDLGSNTLDMSFLRPTDLPFNKKVILPDSRSLEETLEIETLHLKDKLVRATEQYIDLHNEDASNLSKDQKEGLMKLTKKKDTVIYQTDKSGRFSVDSIDNYRVASTPHNSNDTDITEQEHIRIQEVTNAHSTVWSRILRAGEVNKRGAERIKNNLLVENCGFAPQYTLRKDHKPSTDDTLGPPVRPVCGAKGACNNRLSHIISQVLKPLTKRDDNSCSSTEELLHCIRETNKDVLPSDTVVGSLDVKALYPSLDVEHTAKIVESSYVNSEYEVVNTNIEEVGLYIAINMTPQEIAQDNLQDFCPTRKQNRGRPPNMTGCATDNDRSKRFKPWNMPKERPDDTIAKKMLAKALYIAVKFTMENHVYSFDTSMKKQAHGGPIGLELTGEIANIYMSWWDRKFKEQLEQNDIKVYAYKRYVDDINLVVSSGPRGEEEEDVPNDRRTFETAKMIGNGITECIKLTADYPSNYIDKKVPILDLKVWMQDEPKPNGERCVKILHEYYQKPITAKNVIHAQSAMPTKSKRTIVTQEILRVLLNCSPLLPWDRVTTLVNQKMIEVQESGHSQNFRYQVVQSALKAYDKICADDQAGTRPMYRSRDWQRKERDKLKRSKKTNWFKKSCKEPDQPSTVLFIPSTPNSELLGTFNKIIKNTNVNMEVVERAGPSLKTRLQKSNPFGDKSCPDPACTLCRDSPNSMCRRNNITYRIECQICKDKYIGETSRNLYTRYREHIVAYENRSKDSVLYRHAIDKHDSNQQLPFKAAVTGIHKDALSRQLTEAVEISEANANHLINSKAEFGHRAVANLRLHRE